MSSDLDDPGLDRRLTLHGAEFRAALEVPELGSMVTAATARDGAHRTDARRRWVWPLIAAVLLLAVPLITLATVHRHSHAPAAPNDPSLQLLGDVPWQGAVLQPDGRSITVAALVDFTPHYCLDDGLPVLKPVLIETSKHVRIEVRAYRRLPRPSYSVPPGAVLACSAVGHAPVVELARLAAPLGDRSVQGGQTTTVIDAAGFPALGRVPAGYTGGAVTTGLGAQGIPGDGLLFRVYAHGDDRLIVRRDGPGFQSPTVVATGTVHGRPAEVARESGTAGQLCASWTEGGRTWRVCSLGRSKAPLTPPALLGIAGSLR